MLKGTVPCVHPREFGGSMHEYDRAPIEQEAILYIDTWSSTCGACGKGCDPHELTHKTIFQYAPNPGPGCGAKYTALSTNYTGLGEDFERTIRCMRPDLPFLSEMGWE